MASAHEPVESPDLSKLLESLEESPVANQSLILYHRNLELVGISDIRKVVLHEANTPMGEKSSQSIKDLSEQGYSLMTILVLRNDRINYGNSSAVGVNHEIVAVMVKKPKA